MFISTVKGLFIIICHCENIANLKYLLLLKYLISFFNEYNSINS